MILIIGNAIYVDNMNHNLNPPFLIREAGVVVNKNDIIQVDKPDDTEHFIIFPDDNLKISLHLHGVFSYFHHRSPTLNEIDNLEVVFLTPDFAHWNPNSSHFADNEK